MNDTEGVLVGLLYFPKVINKVDLVQVTTDCKIDIVGQVPTCLVTLIKQYAPNEWTSEFWRSKPIVDKALNVLTDGVIEPVFWVMGEYISYDYAELENNHLLPEGVKLNMPTPPMDKSTNLILRQTNCKDVVLPWVQGFGHHTAARIAVFSRSQEPIHLFNEWLSANQAHKASCMDEIMISDVYMPKGAAGWLAPFGEEDRNHALMTKEGVDLDVLVNRFANALNLPLIISEADADEFQNWEDWHKLPKDIADKL